MLLLLLARLQLRTQVGMLGSEVSQVSLELLDCGPRLLDVAGIAVRRVPSRCQLGCALLGGGPRLGGGRPPGLGVTMRSGSIAWLSRQAG